MGSEEILHRRAKGPIIVQNLPGVADLEGKLLIYGSGSPEVEKPLDAFSRAVFGITSADMEFPVPDHYWSLPEFADERHRIDDEYAAHEDRFETTHLTDDEAMEYLKELGLDFADERGHPLRCTQLLMRQAEAAAKGFMGRLPDQQEAEADSWGQSLQAQAMVWAKRKGT